MKNRKFVHIEKENGKCGEYCDCLDFEFFKHEYPYCLMFKDILVDIGDYCRSHSFCNRRFGHTVNVNLIVDNDLQELSKSEMLKDIVNEL
jgi:hypothetical protein